MNQTPRLRSNPLPVQVTNVPLVQDPHLQSVPAAVKNVRTRVVTTLLASSMRFGQELAFLHEVMLEYLQLNFRLYASLVWLNPDLVERMVVAARLDVNAACNPRTWALRGDVGFDDPELNAQLRQYKPQMLIYLAGGRAQGVLQPGVEGLLVSATVVLPSIQGNLRYEVTRRQGVPLGFQLQCDAGARRDVQNSLVEFVPLENQDQVLAELLGQDEEDSDPHSLEGRVGAGALQMQLDLEDEDSDGDGDDSDGDDSDNDADEGYAEPVDDDADSDDNADGDEDGEEGTDGDDESADGDEGNDDGPAADESPADEPDIPEPSPLPANLLYPRGQPPPPGSSF